MIEVTKSKIKPTVLFGKQEDFLTLNTRNCRFPHLSVWQGYSDITEIYHMVNVFTFHKQKIWSKFTRVFYFIHLICSLHIVRQGSKEVLTRMIFMQRHSGKFVSPCN